MPTPLRVLILEDQPADAELMAHELRWAGFAPDWQRVDTESGYLAGLTLNVDVILADYSLPQFDALRALRLLQAQKLDIPFVVVSGSIGEETAVEFMKQGAADYVLKDRLARLGQAVEHALYEKRIRGEKLRAEEEIRRRTAQLEALREIGLELAAELDLDLLLHSIAAHAIRLLGGASGGLGLYRPDRDVLEWAVSIASDPMPIGTSRRRGEGLSGKVWETGQPLIVNDYQSWEGRAAASAAYGYTAILGAPIRWGAEFLGVLVVNADAPRAFSPADAELLDLFATQAAIAIHNARLFQSEREQRELAQVLRETGAAISATLDLDAVLDQLLDQIKRIIPYDAANVMMVEGQHIRVARLRGYDQFGDPVAQAVRSLDLEISSTPNLQQMAETGHPLVIPDRTTFPGWKRDLASEHTRSWAGAPIVVQGKVMAFFSLDKIEPDFYRPEHAERLALFAGQAALALQNARLFRSEQEQFRRLQESQAQLVQVEKMAALGRLVASIAHEINNPLQAVQGSLELAEEELQGDLRPDKLTRYLRMANSEVERLATMVRRLRDFYRPAHERLQPTDVNAITQSVLELAGKQLQHSRVTVECEQAGSLPAIQANPDYLKQVFLNLVLNAIDAMGEQGGTLRVRTALDQMTGRDHQLLPAVRIEFSDTGEGIPPEILDHIFEPFVTTKKTGTGLGLSISYGLIEAHNGRITVTSQVGAGTTFTILLPVSTIN
jgi:signal transduction histidine kinase